MSVSPLLLLHISGGTIGLLSGAAAVCFRKGSRRHGIAGNVFVISMLTLAASGILLAILKHKTGDTVGGALTLYLDAPENAEVADGAGLPFRHDNLPEVIEHALRMSEAERESWRAKAMERVRSRYSWDAVTDAYEKLLMGLAKH